MAKKTLVLGKFIDSQVAVKLLRGENVEGYSLDLDGGKVSLTLPNGFMFKWDGVERLRAQESIGPRGPVDLIREVETGKTYKVRRWKY